MQHSYKIIPHYPEIQDKCVLLTKHVGTALDISLFTLSFITLNPVA